MATPGSLVVGLPAGVVTAAMPNLGFECHLKRCEWYKNALS